MIITHRLAEFLESFVFNSPNPPYWIEIKTKKPTCTYYFGHFEHPLAAKLMQQGYIKDLIDESATVIGVKIKQCQPKQLTIVEAEDDYLENTSLVRDYSPVQRRSNL